MCPPVWAVHRMWLIGAAVHSTSHLLPDHLYWWLNSVHSIQCRRCSGWPIRFVPQFICGQYTLTHPFDQKQTQQPLDYSPLSKEICQNFLYRWHISSGNNNWWENSFVLMLLVSKKIETNTYFFKHHYLEGMMLSRLYFSYEDMKIFYQGIEVEQNRKNNCYPTFQHQDEKPLYHNHSSQ